MLQFSWKDKVTDEDVLKKMKERIPNGHSFNISHMEGIAGELKKDWYCTE